MIPGLPGSSIPQCKLNGYEYTYLVLFPAKGHFEASFIEAHQPSMMIGKLTLLKSRIQTPLFLEEIITSTNEVFKDFESDMAVAIRKLGNLN
jgi:hypothetical protein